jgi:hypothetical protein
MTTPAQTVSVYCRVQNGLRLQLGIYSVASYGPFYLYEREPLLLQFGQNSLSGDDAQYWNFWFTNNQTTDLILQRWLYEM